MKRHPIGPRPLLILAALMSASCATWRSLATEEARRELGCSPDELQVQDLGELSLWPEPRGRLHLFEATGCGDSRVYLCRDAPERRCVSDPRTLWGEAIAQRVLDAIHARRHVSRARCPESELDLVQLDSWLFRLEACDGTWLYDCQAGHCRPLPRKP